MCRYQSNLILRQMGAMEAWAEPVAMDRMAAMAVPEATEETAAMVEGRFVVAQTAGRGVTAVMEVTEATVGMAVMEVMADEEVMFWFLLMLGIRKLI
jgi:hypothetical protein